MRALVSFTLQRNLCTGMCRTQHLGSSLFRLSGWFHIHLFYSSKIEVSNSICHECVLFPIHRPMFVSVLPTYVCMYVCMYVHVCMYVGR